MLFEPRAAVLLLLPVLPMVSACSAGTGGPHDSGDRPRQVSVRVYHSDSAAPNVLVKVPLRTVTGALRLASVARVLGAHRNRCPRRSLLASR